MTHPKLTPAVRAFLEAPRFASLATLNADGSIHQTVMWYELQGDAIMMNTLRGRVKDRNLLNDPRASLIIENGQEFVTISGKITVVDDPERGQRDIKALAVRYDGPESAEEQVASGYSKQERVTLLLSIDHLIVNGI